MKMGSTCCQTDGTSRRPPYRVLVVEDDDLVAFVALDMLEELGFEARRVATADAALEALNEGQAVDLVFSDIMMPGNLDGLGLAKEIRRKRPGLPVVLTSGQAEMASRQAAAQQLKIIPKPYRMEQLRDVLHAASRTRDN
ncbi:MAG TPA: response regulator [Steroidobacteraceae bacterium]